MDMTNWGTRARCRGKDLGTMRLNSSRGLSRLLVFFRFGALAGKASAVGTRSWDGSVVF